MKGLRFVPAIHRATHRIGLYLAALPGGLSQGEAHILACLAASSPTSIGELHRALAHKRSTLTSILDRLVERELITRTVGETDRRTFMVALTPAGRRLANRVQGHLETLEKAVAERLQTGELDALVKALSAVEEEARTRTG
jgi:DNA-binding MarR family transcriptional regulator